MIFRRLRLVLISSYNYVIYVYTVKRVKEIRLLVLNLRYLLDKYFSPKVFTDKIHAQK